MESMWADLLPVGRDGATGGYRRHAWEPADLACREWFAAEAARRGLDLVVDRNGNQWAWWGDPDAAGPGVVTGSHLDSVPDGGAFDGPLGVVGGFAAVDLLRERGHVPTRPLGVVSFTDEEGARFGIACAGSRLLTGALEPDQARGLADRDGTTLADAMRAAGHDPVHLGRDDETLRRVGTLVELHVEQGVDLVDRGAAVGVAHSIWPHGRWRLDLAGEANHAGTTRLVDRDDPMLRLAAAVLRAREAAAEHGTVATIGRVEVHPNGTNAIPVAGAGLAGRARGRTRPRCGPWSPRWRPLPAPMPSSSPGRRRWCSPAPCGTGSPGCSAAHRCCRPQRGTTPGSWPARASRRRCCSSATRPGSATPRPSTPSPTTAGPGSRRWPPSWPT